MDRALWKVPRVLICGQRCGEAGPRHHVEAELSLSLTQWRSVEASRSQEQLLLPTRAAAPRGRRSSLPGLSPTSSRAPRGIQLPLQLLSWAAVAMEVRAGSGGHLLRRQPRRADVPAGSRCYRLSAAPPRRRSRLGAADSRPGQAGGGGGGRATGGGGRPEEQTRSGGGDPWTSLTLKSLKRRVNRSV